MEAHGSEVQGKPSLSESQPGIPLLHGKRGSIKVTHPDNLTYAVDDVPPLPELIFLGLQQVMVISIYLVMVAIVVRAAGTPAEVAQSAVSLGMLALAIGVVLQALWKGPLGSGYLAAPVFSAVYLHPSLAAVAMGGLPLVFGMTMCAGLFEMLLSRLLRHLRAVFPTVVCGLSSWPWVLSSA
jgi:xanthine permease XanP